jgi:hypothetical protein
MTKKPYDGRYGPAIDLRSMEEEVLVEGREWMRRRMEDKLREAGKSFSPGRGTDALPGPAQEADD